MEKAPLSAWAAQRPLGRGLALWGLRPRQKAMPGLAPLRVARGSLDAWLLGGLWLCALGCLCGVGTAAPGAGAGAGGSLGDQRPCQAPQQWEGRQVLYRQSTGRYSRALLSYDGLNQRVRVLDERKALIPCKRYAGRGERGQGGPGRARSRELRRSAGFPAARVAFLPSKINFAERISWEQQSWGLGVGLAHWGRPAGGHSVRPRKAVAGEERWRPRALVRPHSKAAESAS